MATLESFKADLDEVMAEFFRRAPENTTTRPSFKAQVEQTILQGQLYKPEQVIRKEEYPPRQTLAAVTMLRLVPSKTTVTVDEVFEVGVRGVDDEGNVVDDEYTTDVTVQVIKLSDGSVVSSTTLHIEHNLGRQNVTIHAAGDYKVHAFVIDDSIIKGDTPTITVGSAAPPFPADFDFAGPFVVNLGEVNAYRITARNAPTFNGTVLLHDASNSQYQFIVNPPTLTMVNGVIDFTIQVNYIGGFQQGYVRYDVLNPAAPGEFHGVYGDPVDEPYFYQVQVL